MFRRRLVAFLGAMLVVGALVLGVRAFLDDSHPSDDGDLTIRDQIAGERVRLDLPGEGKVEGLAIWFHGQGDDENARMNEDWLNALRDRGWAIASGETGRALWGNAESVEHSSRLIDWAQEQTGVPADLWVAGSMGGVVSLNTLLGTDHAPSCWYGIMPVVDLGSVKGVPNAVTQIAEAFEGDATAGPSDRLDEMPADIRYRVLASPDDTWVPLASNGAVLADALGEAVDVAEARGQHGDLSHFDARDLVDFAAGC